jgi:hypothetical protein
MDFQQLIASMRHKSGSLWWLEKKTRVGRSYSRLYQDIQDVRAQLAGWGVTAGTRVGLYAPNSWRWLVYDLALIDLGAISIAFTDDFRHDISQALLDRHAIDLFLTTKANAGLFPTDFRHIGFIDADNDDLRSPGRFAGPADVGLFIGLVGRPERPGDQRERRDVHAAAHHGGRGTVARRLPAAFSADVEFPAAIFVLWRADI